MTQQFSFAWIVELVNDRFETIDSKIGQNVDNHFAKSPIWSLRQKYFSNYLWFYGSLKNQT
jgi:hypothetical protein